MKILSLHVDYINFKPLKKALKSIAELSDEEKKGDEVLDALAIMTSVEKKDTNIEKVVDKLVEEIKSIASQVNSKNVVLYPYAHLSSDLASPEVAQEVLKKAEESLLKDNFNVKRAPFGYYKEFELKVKGHPLSELSRDIVVEENVKESYDTKKLLKEISKSKLDTSKLKENDHRILAKKMDLFSFNEVAPGMVFWHSNGLTIYNELIKYWRERHFDSGYKEIKTPEVMDSKIWKISGHWDKYADNNFSTEYEKRPFLVKPMNCPGGMIVFKSSPKSYKDLPLRVGEIGVVHRVERSGTLGGLFRMIQFTQDDAHIFCTEEQLEDEISAIMNLINEFYDKFKLEFDHVELSTRPEKRIGLDKDWDKAEKALENVLKKKKMKYTVNKGDGAFYGPKIDFHAKDSQGRTWQLSTIQLDFSMPERFELVYIDKNNEEKRPIMLHRVIYGSIERFLGILLENNNGRLPTWLSPIQLRVLNFTDRNTEYSKKVLDRIKEKIPGIRADLDFNSTTVSSKVKVAEDLKIPYILVLGDKEESDENIAVRVKGNSKIEKLKLDDFIEKLKKEVYERL